MKIINLSLKTPEENIRMDEELLLSAEKGSSSEVVRFWESGVYFVVMGVSGKAEKEVDSEACSKDNIPVIRRSSAGGTVLQGPGCLNFSLILSYNRDKSLGDVNKSYVYILDKIIASAKQAAGWDDISFKPVSDIIRGNRKVSGNAQQRKRKFMLHHGTWLYDFNLELISKYLKEPPKQPEYRAGRKHGEFITNVPLDIEKFKKYISESFGRAHAN